MHFEEKKEMKIEKSFGKHKISYPSAISFENQGEISEISAISSELREDKNKEFYEMKSQYLSDEIFFAKFTKKPNKGSATSPSDPFLTGYHLTLNREKSEESRGDIKKVSFDFLESGSIITTSILLIVSTVGGGLLSIPSAFYSSGIVGGLLFFLIFGGLTYYSSILMVESCDLCKRYSYCGLIEASLTQKWGKILMKIIYFLNNWGIVLIYIIRINQIFTSFASLFTNIEFLTNPKDKIKFFQLLVMFFFVLPQSLFRQYSSLRYGYFLGFIFLIYLTVSTIFSSSLNTDFVKNLNESSTFGPDQNTFYTALFAYTCHNNLPDIFLEVKKVSKTKMITSLKFSFLFCMLIYILIGFFAIIYLKEPQSQENYFNTFSEMYMKIAFFLFGLYIVFIIPLKIKPCKDAVLDIFFPNEQRDEFQKHFILTFIICLLSLIPSIFINNPDWIIHALGIVFNPLVCFAFPTFFFIKLHREKKFSIFQKISFFFFIVIIPVYGILEFLIELIEKKDLYQQDSLSFN